MNCSASGLRVTDQPARRRDGAGRRRALAARLAGRPAVDRYLPLHTHLVELIGEDRTPHVHPDNPLLLPRENGKHDSCSTRTIQCERFEVRRRAGITWLRPGVSRCRIDMR